MSQEKPAWVTNVENKRAEMGLNTVPPATSDNTASPSSGGSYTPAGKGSDYYMNNTDGKGTSMSASDQAALKAAGDAYNKATNEDERKAAHAAAEKIREKYGYSGGQDGSEYIPTAKPQAQAPVYTPQAPDFTGLLDSWLETAKQQQQLGIDYATQKGVNDLQRAEEDAQEQFQTQQNQVDENEAKALDNQALYAEARGDRGGIGQAQYGQIQAQAMQNRRAINTARTKLSTDTARAIADLRAQGEFKKADALLQLTQTYLGQLIDLQKWGAEYSLNVAQLNAQLQQWQAEFELESQKFTESLNQWDKEFNYAVSQDERNALAKSGAAALSVGVRPSAAQQAAMGYTDAQIDAELAAYKLALASGSGGGGNNPGKGTTSNIGDVYEKMYAAGVKPERAYAYLIDAGYAAGAAKEIADTYDMLQDELRTGHDESMKKGIDQKILNNIIELSESGYSVSQLYNLIAGYVAQGKLTETQADWIAESFGFGNK